MKKVLLIICVASILVSCGNTKPDHVSDNKLTCIKSPDIGSKIPTKTCKAAVRQNKNAE